MTISTLTPVARDDFRNAMSRLAASVNLITTDGPAGRHGLTATAVCSVTDSPPTLLVCVNRLAGAHDPLSENGVFCVNLLAGDQEVLSNGFGGRGMDLNDRFALGAWQALVTGAPALDGAVASFDCRLSARAEIGTHTVFYGEVVAIKCSAEPAVLLYGDRAYHRVGGLDEM